MPTHSLTLSSKMSSWAYRAAMVAIATLTNVFPVKIEINSFLGDFNINFKSLETLSWCNFILNKAVSDDENNAEIINNRKKIII